MNVVGALFKTTPALLFLAVHASADPVCVHALLGTDLSVKEAQELAKHILANRGPVEEKVINPWPEHLAKKGIERPHGHAENIEIRGYPSHIKAAEIRNRIFRHYTYDLATVESIKTNGILINGPRVYDEASIGLYHRSYLDLTGIFLTLPKVDAFSVGVGSRQGGMFYVDVKIPESVPVLEVKQDKVFLVPLPKRSPPWLEQIYYEYKNGKAPENKYLERLLEMEREGGPRARSIPVEVVGFGKS